MRGLFQGQSRLRFEREILLQYVILQNALQSIYKDVLKTHKYLKPNLKLHTACDQYTAKRQRI